jgi:hypothetical protein
MQIYRIEWQDFLDAVQETYAATRADAHTIGKNPERRETVRIELHELEPSKANVVAIFRNGEVESVVLSTWSLTERGGLQECANGE